jgi:membrane associated rhomboid family serine protease
MTDGTRVVPRKGALATTKRAALALRTQAVTLGGAVATFWGVFAANWLVGGALDQFGIIPRTIVGLRGILFGPFIHGNLNHIVSNSVPFVVLGWLVMLRDSRHFIRVTLMAMLGAGLMAWAIGDPGSVTIGASGVIFGYLGFLMLSGWYARSLASILISIGVTALWGGVVFGVLPGQPGISWQAHLGGFIGGILAARSLRRR